MIFTSPSKVLSLITASDAVERERSENRDKIAKGINGFPPLSTDKAKQMGLKINISWLEETVLAKQAGLQYHNAFQSRNNYFTVAIPSAPPEKKTDWELLITQFINKPLKASREYAALFDNETSSVIAHGIGPKIWLSHDKWLADFIAINDLRVATDTETSLRNLCWFAVRRRYTIGELVQRVFGKYSDKGWDKPNIINILAAYWDKNWENITYDWSNQPERMTQLVKQNIGYYMSDAVPVITLWHFYHLDDSKPLTKQWMMKVIPDRSCRGVSSADGSVFLYESDKPVAEKIDHLLHIQFGDLNGTPPFLYHAVRSLGFLLHESCFWMNLFRCRTFQHAWENFNLLWRSSDGSPKARAQFLELFHKGYVPNDVTIVPREQKNQINQELVEFVMAQAKQLMGEASASYTQNIDTGTAREQTLGEAQIKLQQSNAMMTGILMVAARNKVFEYREICRRFCLKKSLDPDARLFQQQCKEAGIPKQFLDPDLWDIACDMPLGSGNQTLELAQATQLMSVRTAHGPDAQQEILHIFDAAITQNPQLAQRLAPVGGNQGISTGQMWAAAIFGTLMQGTIVPMQPDMNPIDQIKTLLGLSAGVIQRIVGTDNIGSADDLAGLGTVFQYIQQLIGVLAQDKEQQQLVKQFSDALGKLTNLCKGFQQRQSEANQTKNAPKVIESITFDKLEAYPEAQAALLQQVGLPPNKNLGADPKIAKAAQQMQQKNDKFIQDQNQKSVAFQLEELRKLTSHQTEMSQDERVHNQELIHNATTKLQELLLSQPKPEVSGNESVGDSTT